MKTTLLNGFTDPRHPVAQALLAELHARGDTVTDFALANVQIADCMGDFHCWVRYPGTCAIQDANHDIARSVIESDLVIFLTPVAFGGYSSTLKKAVDHLIQNVQPFFARVNGEVHHARRYKQYPSLLVVGWLPEPAAAAEAVFRYLAERNAVNLYAPRFACGFVYGDQPAGEALRHLLARAEKESCPKKPTLSQDVLTPDRAEEIAPRKVVLLNGSPRGPKSSSASLGNYLLQGFTARGIQTESIHAHFALRQPERLAAALDTVAQADLLVVAFPLYVDSLPAPLIHFLEVLAECKAGPGPAQSMVAIANCGFPEAGHNHPALAICRQFARQTGRAWMGGLALGAGEGIVHQQPLEEGGGRTFSIRRSLDLSAEALAAGKPVPAEAIALFARPVIPNQVYMWMGAFGWKQQAKHWGVEKRMKAQPYKESEIS